MSTLIAETKNGETVMFDLRHVAFQGDRCLVEDEVLGIVEIRPETVRCQSKESRQLAAEVLALLGAINDWFGENPEAAPHEPPWAKDFYALMEKLGELERPKPSHYRGETRTVSGTKDGVTWTTSHSVGGAWSHSTSPGTKKE